MCSTIEDSQITSPEKPLVSEELAVKLALKYYGIRASKVKEFESYGDRNFYLQGIQTGREDDAQKNNKKEFVLKVLNCVDSTDKQMISLQNGVMFFLKERGISCCFPVLSLCGKHTVFENSLYDFSADYKSIETENNSEVKIRDESLKVNAIHLMTYVPGQPLRDVNPSAYSSELLYKLGKYAATLDKTLQEYNHPDMKSYTYSWDLQYIHKLQPYITVKYLGSAQRVDLIQNVYQKYINIVPPVLTYLDKQVIHNDVNDRNIIVQENVSVLSDQQFSIIDFGDMCYSYRVFEVAIVMSDIMLRQFIRSGGGASLCDVSSVLRGYQSIYPLSEEELGIVYWCIAGRFAQRLVFSSVKLSTQPDNKCVTDLELPIWDLLPMYLAINDTELLDKWLN